MDRLHQQSRREEAEEANRPPVDELAGVQMFKEAN
jgi:hypothetical protein